MASWPAWAIPGFWGGFTKAPFDTIGDTLRGTKGIMLDIYRQPKKLLEALEALVPLMIKLGVGAAQMTGKPIIFMPLHKGADGFLSDEQFEKFYWPTLRKVILGLIEEGCVPNPAAEGGYNSRLSRDQGPAQGQDPMDVRHHRHGQGQGGDGATQPASWATCPPRMLSLGMPKEVKEYAKKLIDVAGKGGGFILSQRGVL